MARSRRTPKKPEKNLSRQRRWQLKHQAAGLCIICGQKRNIYAQHCDDCHKRICEGGPWKAGARGRPPNSIRPADKNVLVI